MRTKRTTSKERAAAHNLAKKILSDPDFKKRISNDRWISSSGGTTIGSKVTKTTSEAALSAEFIKKDTKTGRVLSVRTSKAGQISITASTPSVHSKRKKVSVAEKLAVSNRLAGSGKRYTPEQVAELLRIANREDIE